MPDEDLYFSDTRLSEMIRRAASVILDMNGLIVDDEPIQLEAMNLALARFGIVLSRSYWTGRCAGRRSEEFTRRILSEHGLPNSAGAVSDIVSIKNERYAGLVSKSVRAHTRPGVLDLVSFIRENGDRTLSLATTASPLEVEAVLGVRGLNIKSEFYSIVTGEDISRYKPAPDIYLRVSALAGVRPGLCLVFEDSGPGVAAAKSAGMPCIAVPNESTAGQDFSGAAFIVSGLTREARILDPQRRVVTGDSSETES